MASQLTQNEWHTSKEDDDDDADSEKTTEMVLDNDGDVNQDYLEFIKITRLHQAKRAKQRQAMLKKKPQLAFEEYYIDISQVNTIVADNLVEAPERGDDESKFERREQQLIELYGDRKAYEKIRSMEMYLDDQFNKKYQELNPHFWPVIPINSKPYLNPIRADDSD